MKQRAAPPPTDSIPVLLDQRLPVEICSEAGFARWFEPWRERVMVAVLEVHEAASQCLDEEQRRVLGREGVHRRVWELTGTDGRSLLKSAASAWSKIGRELQERQSKGSLPPGRLSREQIEQILLSFPDLGRFRVVCDFSCDVDAARVALLTGRPRRLLGKYPLAGQIKDYTNDPDLRRPTRGHRAVQLAARVPAVSSGRSFLIEIQLMTQLQAAWDLRNHPIYEWSRDGGQLPAHLVLRDVALAEALHLVDLQATANWRSFVRRCRQQRGRP
jgi:ppGpp synthetase/RelA/SpoT-type nucleotidyltranferase